MKLIKMKEGGREKERKIYIGKNNRRRGRRIVIKMLSSSSSSYRAGSTDIPDPLSPLLPIVHRPRQVFRTTTCILT